MANTVEQRLIDELEQERRRAAEILDQAQRIQAEFMNYRRRKEQEMQDLRRLAGERLIRQLLPVVDDFHRAIEAVPEAERANPWIQGILLIERKLWSILEAEGVRPIEAVGQPFDPSLHEAVTVEEGADGADTVVAEFQRGYMLHDRVIRPSMVKVGKGGNGPSSEPSEAPQ
ncbi:MAG: nucleotide exchange factor GrpE, partial [Thermomicrobiaceae bacterium]|nr:nucleotide exchange factor GrpE [Thermomicrobiaceae bacterium]